MQSKSAVGYDILLILVFGLFEYSIPKLYYNILRHHYISLRHHLLQNTQQFLYSLEMTF